MGDELDAGKEGLVLQARPSRLHNLVDCHDDHDHPYHHFHSHELDDYFHDQDHDPDITTNLHDDDDAVRNAVRNCHDVGGVHMHGGAERLGVDA